MGRGAVRHVWLAPLFAAVVGVLVYAAPSTAAAQAQEAIELGRLEVEDARDLLGCFRTYLRDATRAPGADLRLRTCALAAHGRVTTVTVAAIRYRARNLALAISRLATLLHRAENGELDLDDVIDEARAAVGESAAEIDHREARL